MSNNKTLGIISWLLGLVLSNILLFCLERELTPTFWVTTAFVWTAFISMLVFQLVVWKNYDKPDIQFMKIPAISVSMLYIAVQFPICIIFSLGSNVISVKTTIFVNGVLLIIAWGFVIGTLLGNDHIQRVNDRQRNHHTEL